MLFLTTSGIARVPATVCPFLHDRIIMQRRAHYVAEHIECKECFAVDFQQPVTFSDDADLAFFRLAFDGHAVVP